MSRKGVPHHLAVTVRSVSASSTFYKLLLVDLLGYKCIADTEKFVAFIKDGFEFYFTEASADSPPHTKGHIGFHHLAFNADTKESVDDIYQNLVQFYNQHGSHKESSALGGKILDPPQFYPNYGKHYYAVFFTDPNGMKLEVVHHIDSD